MRSACAATRWALVATILWGCERYNGRANGEQIKTCRTQMTVYTTIEGGTSDKPNLTETKVNITRCCKNYHNTFVMFCGNDCNHGCAYNTFCNERQGYTCPGCTINKDLVEAECEADCKASCGPNKCLEPDVCNCPAGYFFDKSNFTCAPKCNKNRNCFCKEPEKCDKCYTGYHSLKPKAACVPDCPAGCKDHGSCLKPDVCTCHKDYRHTDNVAQKGVARPICVPECNASLHCKCTEPRKCSSCLPGYHSSSPRHPLAGCSPDCPASCANGCTRPNACRAKCKARYEHAAGDDTRCVPACAKPYINCVCVEPGVCRCNEGHARREEDGKNATCKPTTGARSTQEEQQRADDANLVNSPGFIAGAAVLGGIAVAFGLFAFVVFWKRRKERLQGRL